MTNRVLESALYMASRGFRILPVLPNSKAPFSFDPNDLNSSAKTNCSPKDRILAGSYKIATRDPATIKRWFAHKLDPTFGYKGEHINYGVSGFGQVVIDVDVKPGKTGLDDLLTLGSAGVSFPPTFTVTTPSGGIHYYFAGFECGSRGLTKSIDVRSRHGFVVGPGSIIDGRSYEINNDQDPVTIPQSLADRLGKLVDKTTDTAPVTDLDLPKTLAFVAKLLETEPVIAHGGRNNAAYPLACAVKDFGVSAEKMFELMDKHWNQRFVEPLEEGDLKAICDRAYSSGRYAPGIRNVAVEFDDVEKGVKEIFGERTNKGEICFRLITQRDAADIPPRPWLVPGLILQKSLSAIVAQPGARKSTFTICLAIGFALGTLDHLGMKLRVGPTNVMLINNEDDEDEIDRRIFACCQINNLDYKEAKKRIHIYHSDAAVPFTAVKGENQKMKESEEFLQMRGYIIKNQIGIAIFDPLAEMHEGDESDNSHMVFVMKTIRRAVRDQNIGGVVVHHTRKPDVASSRGYAGDPHSARGASAILGNVRVMATLCNATREDGWSIGLPPGAFEDYSRLDIGKGSYSKAGKDTRWYKCDSCRVGPSDYDDTAAAMTFINRNEQAAMMIEEIHKALREHKDKFNDKGEMHIDDAVEAIVSGIGVISHEDAKGYLKALFYRPQTSDGVTFRYIMEGKKEKVVDELNWNRT